MYEEVAYCIGIAGLNEAIPPTIIVSDTRSVDAGCERRGGGESRGSQRQFLLSVLVHGH